MGRRRKGAAGKLYPLSMRTTKEIREKLDAAAQANGRSLAQEVEERLYSTFINRDEIFGGDDLYRLMSMMALAIRTIEEADGERWHYPMTRPKVAAVCPEIVNMMAYPLHAGSERLVSSAVVAEAIQSANQFSRDFREFLRKRAEERGFQEYLKKKAEEEQAQQRRQEQEK